MVLGTTGVLRLTSSALAMPKGREARHPHVRAGGLSFPGTGLCHELCTRSMTGEES